MATEDQNMIEDAEMAECEGDKVVTMMDVLQEQQEFEEDANAVLGASDDKNCTYAKGYIKRQAIYACLTCCPEAKDDPSKRGGVCLACSLMCHENHELVELYTKRNFRCDCGNPNFNSHPCQFTPDKLDFNEENIYNQNFSGLYCICKRPYPDPDASFEDDMIQCIICEDWLHASHLDAVVPGNEQYTEMICKACMEKNEFLHDYTIFAVNVDAGDDVGVDVVNLNGDKPDISPCNGDVEKIVNGVDTKEMEEKSENQTPITNGTDEETEDNMATESKIEESTPKLNVDIKPDETSKVESTDVVPEEKDSIKEDSTKIDLNVDEETRPDRSSEIELTIPVLAENGNSVVDSIKMDEEIKPDESSKVEFTEPVPVETDNSEIDNTKTDMTIDEESKSVESSKIDSTDATFEKKENSAVDSTEMDLDPDNQKDTTCENVENSESNDNTDRPEASSEIESDVNESFIHASKDEKIENNNKEAKENESGNTNADAYHSLEEAKQVAIEETSAEGKLDNSKESEKGTETNEVVKNSQSEAEMKKQDTNSDPVMDAIDELLASESKENPATKESLSENKEISESTEEKASEVVKIDASTKPEETDKNDCVDVEMNNSTIANAALSSGNEDDNKLNETEPDKVEPDENPTKESEALIEDGKLDEIDTTDKHSSNGKESPNEHKRKLSTDSNEDKIPKKAKFVEKCSRPRGGKRIHKGATFWPPNFRSKLCTCGECISMYKDLNVLFLTDLEDTVSYYESIGKSNIDSGVSQYEKGMQALSSLDRIQQINALTEYNNMRDKLLDFLKSFKERKEIVKEEDIKAFFAGMKPRREPDGVYFCR